jgi:hypothetical protein
MITDLEEAINSELSETAHRRMLKNPEEWHEYHRRYREERIHWKVLPYEQWIDRIRGLSPNIIIDDFGC